MRMATSTFIVLAVVFALGMLCRVHGFVNSELSGSDTSWGAGTRTRYDTGIDPDSPPHLSIAKRVSRSEIWQRGDLRSPRNTTVFLNISGEGNPAINFNSQDVVFTIDSSTSMNSADHKFLRLDAAKNYVNRLIPPDRAAVISFSGTAELVQGHHLSTDYDRVREDLSDWTNKDGTNFKEAIELTNREFIDHGGDNRSWVCILLTDGKPEPLSTNITTDVLNETIDNNITIYTIGLYRYGSPSQLDEGLLKWIARNTGGEYFVAEGADDLESIYEKIAMRFRNYTAGFDPDPLDEEPMIRDVVPKGFHIDNDSFSKYPDAIYVDDNGTTVLEWNVSEMLIGEGMEISYNVSSDLYGHVAVHPYGRARVMYHIGVDRHEVYFPQLSIWVLSSVGLAIPPPPPSMPPPPAPPPPPPGGYPIPVTTPAAPTVIPLTTPTGLPAAASPVVFPVEYMVGGFIGLGIIERLKLKKLLLSKQKVAVGT